MDFCLTLALFEEIKRKHPRGSASSYFIEAKKIELLEQLQNSITKLKEARLEIQNAIQVALKLKEAGDDIAERVVAAVAQIFTVNGDTLCA